MMQFLRRLATRLLARRPGVASHEPSLSQPTADPRDFGAFISEGGRTGSTRGIPTDQFSPTDQFGTQPEGGAVIASFPWGESQVR